jgi:uncharacterized membrane protein (DUF373 family)
MSKKAPLNRIAKFIEKGIIHALIVMMAIILFLATIELGYYLVKNIMQSDYLLIDLDDLMDLFGVFLLVLIGIELLDTIKVYLRENVVHVEVVVLVAIIAVARKVVILKIEELTGDIIIGIAVLIVALAISYYLIKKAGLFICDFNKPDVEEKNVMDYKEEEIIVPDEKNENKM